MAGQDAVLGAAAIEREAHMRATVVERDHASAVVHDKDRPMSTMNNKPPRNFQLLQVAGAHEIRSQAIHGGSSESFCDGAFGEGPLRMSIQLPTAETD